MLTGCWYKTLKLGFLGISLPSKSAFITDSGSELYPTTTIAQIARAVASILSKPEATANKYLNISSFTTTQNEIVKAGEEVTGLKWHVTQVTSEERLKEGSERVATGDIRGIGNMWNYWCSNGGKGRAFKKEELANQLLELKEENLVDVIKGLL